MEFCHPEWLFHRPKDLVGSEGLNPGPSRCSGRQATRGRRRDYVILRSEATKNLGLVLKALKSLKPGPSLCSGRQKGCHPEGLFHPPEGSGVVLKALNPGPSLRSGRQGQVLRCAQDDNQPEAGVVIMSF